MHDVYHLHVALSLPDFTSDWTARQLAPPQTTSAKRVSPRKSRVEDDDVGPLVRQQSINYSNFGLFPTNSQWLTVRSAKNLSGKQTSIDTWTPSASCSSTNHPHRQHRPSQRQRASSLHQPRKGPPASRNPRLGHRRSSMVSAALSRHPPRDLLRRRLSRPNL